MVQIRQFQHSTLLHNGYVAFVDDSEKPLHEVWLIAPDGRTMMVTSTYERNLALATYKYCVDYASQLPKG